MGAGPDQAGMARLLTEQSGVVTRRQLIGLGCRENDLRRLIRRRELVVVHPGVYVDHTGPLTRLQRQWAAVLFHWPAALHREDALAAHGLTRDSARDRDTGPVHVLVPESQRRGPAPGTVVERVRGAAAWTVWHRRPPRARLEFALLKVAADRDEAGAVAVLADAVQQGRTTAARLTGTLEALVRLPHRRVLLAVLADVAADTHLVLERRYLVLVERAHGLPRGERQRRVVLAGSTTYTDVRYPAQEMELELDGAFGHQDTEDRWADLSRDLGTAARGAIALRAGWAQVLEPCRLAGLEGTVLRHRGWQGAPVPCGDGCDLIVGGWPSPGDCQPPRSA